MTFLANPIFICLLEQSVELLSEEVELKEGGQAELWATVRGAFHLANALDWGLQHSPF